MPQLDTVTFLSQLFWLVIIFGAFYLTVLTDILPSFSRVLKSRLKKLKSNKDAMYSLGDEKGETSSLYDSSLSTGLDGSRANLLDGLNSGSTLMKNNASSTQKTIINRINHAIFSLTDIWDSISFFFSPSNSISLSSFVQSLETANIFWSISGVLDS